MNVSLEEYFRTTFEDKLLVKMPEREDDHLTSATRLLEKKREMLEVEAALAAQKEEFQMKMESLAQRREELEKKEFQLKESLLRFDKFLKENDAKRSRAIRKADDERDYRKQKESEIEKIQDDIQVYSKLKERLQVLVDKYQKCQKYLEKVIESSEEFTEIREIVDRYETLTSTYKDLKAREDRTHDGIENKKSDQMHYKEEKVNQVLNQNNELADLRSLLEAARSLALQKEVEWTRVKSDAATRTLQLGMARVSTYNLYQLVSSYQPHRNAAEVSPEDMDSQLTRIQQVLNDLSLITDTIKNGGYDTPT